MCQNLVSQVRTSWWPRVPAVPPDLNPEKKGFSGHVAGGGTAAEEPPRRDVDVGGLRTRRSQSPNGWGGVGRATSLCKKQESGLSGNTSEG